MTTDLLALTSDGVKYTPVAVDKDDNWQNVVPYDVEYAQYLSCRNDHMQYRVQHFVLEFLRTGSDLETAQNLFLS